MPIYEYSCEKCHKIFEEWTRRVDDNVSQTCPECGGSAHRIVSNTSFVLKGGGWYVTEYGNRKGASEGGPASASAPPGETAASGSERSSTASERAPSAPKAESAPAAAPAQAASSGTAS